MDAYWLLKGWIRRGGAIREAPGEARSHIFAGSGRHLPVRFDIRRSGVAGATDAVLLALAPLGATLAAPAAPDAKTLLKRSVAVMQASVHAAHGAGMSQITFGKGKSAAATITGDCTFSGRTMAMQFSLRGTGVTNGKVQPLHQDFIWIAAGKRSRSWMRSSSPTTPWHTSTSDEAMGGLHTCPRVMASQYAMHLPPNLKNLGIVRVNGESAWHLHSGIMATRGGMKGSGIVADLYIATGSLHWLRFQQTYASPRMRQYVLVDYSRYNVPVKISAPNG